MLTVVDFRRFLAFRGIVTFAVGSGPVYPS